MEAEQVPSFAALLGEQRGAVPDRIAAAFCRAPDLMAHAIEHVARALDQAKVRGDIAFPVGAGFGAACGLSAAVVRVLPRQRLFTSTLRTAVNRGRLQSSQAYKTVFLLIPAFDLRSPLCTEAPSLTVFVAIPAV